MSEPKYMVGDEVFYFDSFIGAIVGSKVKEIDSIPLQTKTPEGHVICTKYFISGYKLSNGITVKEYLLFRDPVELIDHYLKLLQEIRNLNLNTTIDRFY